MLLVLLGPSVGFVAAGMLYGTTSGRGEAIGQTLQAVASWVSCCLLSECHQQLSSLPRLERSVPLPRRVL